MQELKRSGGYLLNANELQSVETLLNGVAEKDFIGKDAAVILNAANINAPENIVVIVAEVDKNHIFVIDEYLMPILPVVRVHSFDDAVKANSLFSLIIKSVKNDSETLNNFFISPVFPETTII